MENEKPFLIQRLLIGASASIGIVNLISYLVQFQMQNLAKEVQVILTEQATNFVNPTTVRMFCQGVHTKMLDETSGGATHVDLAEWADVFVIMPASADIIGKAANGLATDLLSTTILAARCPVIFLPNMNFSMYSKPASQRNIQQLQKDGYFVIEPENSIGYQVSKRKVVEAMSIPQPITVMNHLANIYQNHTTNSSKGGF